MILRAVVHVVVAAVVLAAKMKTADAVAPSFCGAAGWKQVWGDDFSGKAVDPSRWNVEVAPRQPATMHCRGAGCAALGSCREAACTAASAEVTGGRLVLTSDRDPTDRDRFTTGAVNTWGKAEWHANPAVGPFRLCVSAILPGVGGAGAAAQGIWPAHWLMPHDDTCDPDEGEMDIMEMVNGDGQYHATYHWQTTFPTSNCSYPTGHGSSTTEAPVQIKAFNTTLHEYAVERGPSWVAFAFDGVVQRNITLSDVPKPVFWDVPWYLIINTAIGGGWPGPPNASTLFPVHHAIDYVHVSRLV